MHGKRTSVERNKFKFVLLGNCGNVFIAHGCLYFLLHGGTGKKQGACKEQGAQKHGIRKQWSAGRKVVFSCSIFLHKRIFLSFIHTMPPVKFQIYFFSTLYAFSLLSSEMVRHSFLLSPSRSANTGAPRPATGNFLSSSSELVKP